MRWGLDIATGCVTIASELSRVCMIMTYSSIDNKRRVYDSIRLPHIFLGSPGTCASNVYQALSPPLEGPEYKANHSLILCISACLSLVNVGCEYNIIIYNIIVEGLGVTCSIHTDLIIDATPVTQNLMFV